MNGHDSLNVKLHFNLTPFYFFRAFSFKKKSSSGTTKLEVPTKVISNNVLANRNVNVPKNSLVTKSPVTFSNKLQKPQKSKINTFFNVNSKGKLDPVNPAVSAIKVTTAPTKSDGHFPSGTHGNSTSLDVSLGFPVDDWDDFDDFETPAKAKNDSFNLEISGKSANPISSPSEEKIQTAGNLNHDASLMTPELSCSFASKPGLSRSEQFGVQMDGLECSDVVAVSPVPSFNQDPAEYELEDSPVRSTKRRHPAHLSSIISDSEEDKDVEFESYKETAGKKSVFLHYLYEFFYTGEQK